MDCGQIPRIDYGKFSAELHSRAWLGTTLPVNGTIELTARCNLRCRHCYVPWDGRLGNAKPLAPTNDASAAPDSNVARTETSRPPLGFEEVCRLIDDIAAEGCLWLLITGGEPLMRTDFLDIYLHAKRKGLLISLFTNATLMAERIADVLAEYPPFAIEVSLYGATKATYERITSVPGSYGCCMRGINLLMERRLPLKLKTMVLKGNRDELEQMESFAAERGLSFRWDHQVHAQLDGCRDPLQTRLTPEEMVELDLANPQRAEGWRDLIDRTRDVRIGSHVFGCGAGIGSFHIDAYGYMQLCGFVRAFSYDLRRGSFHDGYFDYFPYVRSLPRRTTSLCDDCALVNVCGICPAWQQIEGGGLEGPIEYIHSYAMLLSARLGVQKPAGVAG